MCRIRLLMNVCFERETPFKKIVEHVNTPHQGVARQPYGKVFNI